MHNFDVSAVEYRDYKFILGTDCEKVLDAGFTGLNTRSGDLLSVSLKYANAGTAVNGIYPRLADRIHIVLHSDQKRSETVVAKFSIIFSILKVTNKNVSHFEQQERYCSGQHCSS